MKKLLVVIAVITMVLATSGVVLADDSVSESPGPATGSGDGDPNEDCLQYGPYGSIEDPGAPNSGDGIPDGPGW